MRKVFFFLFCILFCFLGLFSQNSAKEKGYYLVNNYSPKDYGGLAQNFSIIEDERGVIYFGNNSGIIQYDGVNFSIIQSESKSRIRTVYETNSGRIFAGGLNEFGFLLPNEKGKLEYREIDSLLPDTLAFDEIWQALETREGLFLRSESYLFKLKDNRIEFWEFPNPKRITKIFSINENIYLQVEGEGLLKKTGERFERVLTESISQDRLIDATVQLSKSEVLIGFGDGGLAKITATDTSISLLEFKTDVDEIIDSKIRHLALLPDNNIAISTGGEGLFFIDQNGRFLNVINDKSGLRDQIVEFSFVDQRGNLWLSLSTGISRVELLNPLTYFKSESKLEGTIESICRFKNVLYCGTHDGVYRLIANEFYSSQSDYLQPDFELVSDEQCWDLLPITIEGDEILLGAFNDGIYEIKENGELEIIAENYPWKLHQSKQDSSIIYIGLAPGFGFMKYHEGDWIVGNENYDFPDIRSLSEINKTLWISSDRDGLSFGLQNIQLQGDTQLIYNLIEIEDSTKLLPRSPVFSSKFNGQPIFGTDSIIYTYDENYGGFKPFEKQLKSIPGKRYYHRLLNQKNKKLWAITVLPNEDFEFGFFDESNNFEWISNPFKIITDGIIHALHADSDGVVWLGGPEGLFRYDPKIKKDFKKPFVTHIRKVVVNRTNIIFGGAFFVDSIGIVDYQPEHMVPTLEHEQNHLTFEFAAFAESDPEKHQYQFRLLGLEEEWSPPTNEPKAVYTNLESGEYTFEVKSTNIYGVTSPAASYQFSINPPWYETPWYYGGQFGFLGLLVFFTVYLNRSKRDSEYTAVITFIALITVFEFIIFLIEPLMEPFFGGVPVFNLIMNIILAMSLNPVEYWVRGILKKNKEKATEEA